MSDLILCLRTSWAKSPKLALLSKSNAGFTLIEMMIVVLIVGILSAISAPAWSAFVNRQRLNKANDAVFGALQQAQREAKRTKRSYSVGFMSYQNNVSQSVVSQFVIYPPDNQNGCPIPSLSDPGWTNLGESSLQPKQVLLYANIASITCNATPPTPPPKPNQIDPSGTSLAGTVRTITFDATGALPLDSSIGLKVVVAQAQPGASQPSTLNPNVMKRCVIVQTLIGAMQTAIDPDPLATIKHPCN